MENNFSVSSLLEAAKEVYPDSPMMQKVAVTQAIHESNLLGKPSLLARKYNNLFGIKGSGTAGSANLLTWEHLNGKDVRVRAKFAANASLADSFRQHHKLMQKPRYAPVLKACYPIDAFHELQDCGYATDPKYAQKLIKLYAEHVQRR